VWHHEILFSEYFVHIYNVCFNMLLETEVKQLRENLAEFSVHQFEPTLDVIKKYKDGGVAIIDQWICAHAR